MSIVHLNKTGNRIGLFGGSFDPPHGGHAKLVQAGLDMGLDEVWVIPALPVHRALSGLADAGMRRNWLKRMFSDQPRVQVLDWEIRRGRSTPAIETLRQFHHMYPHTIPWLMMGADAWAGLPTWREYPAHCELCNVLVFARSGTALETVCGHDGWQQTDPDDWLNCRSPGRWAYVQADLPDISATGLRRDAGLGVTLQEHVPECIRPAVEAAYKGKSQACSSALKKV